MHASLETLRLHVDYTAWASRRLLDAAAALDPAELSRDFGTSEKSVLGTMLHIYGGDYVWIERMHGTSPSRFPAEGPATLAELQSAWPIVWVRWRQYAAGLSEETVESSISYRLFNGNAYASPVWQIILHVVNHGTHHRGQASGFIRALGKNPPPLDLIAYYRQLAK